MNNEKPESLNEGTLDEIKKKLADKQPKPGKVLPPKMKHAIGFDWFRVFTWRERIAMLFGYGLFVRIQIMTQHNPGQIMPTANGYISPWKNAEEHVKNMPVRNVLEEVPKKM